MPNWSAVLSEIKQTDSQLDQVRRKYLKKLSAYTGRPTIAYYSGWLSRGPSIPGVSVNDEDKNAMMTTIHRLPRDKGLDLILHTPGGALAAAESIVDYLRKMFGTDIRAIIPQLAMSAGTMIACACKSIVMGKQSNLGPIDPQMSGVPASGVIAEFRQAIKEVKADPASAIVWQVVIGKYHPTFLGECQKSIDWSEKVVKEWLISGMFEGDPQADQKAIKVVNHLSDHDATLSHSRHIPINDCMDYGLKIEAMEDDDKLQDLILTVHHAYMHTFAGTLTAKIVENHMGVAVVHAAREN